jgi:hypothetical protein
MERLGKPRHGREGRRLSEREVSESNLSMPGFEMEKKAGDVSTSLHMTNEI